MTLFSGSGMLASCGPTWHSIRALTTSWSSSGGRLDLSPTGRHVCCFVGIDNVSGSRHDDVMDDLAVLQKEFSDNEDAFLAIVIRDQTWDREAFSHLERAMRGVCAAFEERDQRDLPRWLVEGF
ncbi:hypothetical protein [Streptomyces sp. NPDC090798]|uniref:hypothetical protein n=1 Tax=Streptomyces sp. NPDC090798 TaxID=3365968 RepID=UPI0038253950